jgi:lysozyme family protein
MSLRDAVDLIIEIEGGDKLVEDPRDPGGLTKYGISQRAFPNEDIRNLTVYRARELYEERYWNRIRGYDIIERGIALAMFDCAVNQGVNASIRLMQRSIGVKDDGDFGPITLRTLNACSPADILPDFFQRRLKRYRETPNYDIYGRGWERRLFHIAILC